MKMKSLCIVLICSILLVNCTATSGERSSESSADSIPEKATDITPLLIGQAIPDITLQNTNNEPAGLLEISSQNTLFVFYRGGWCPFCSTELAELASIEDSLYSMGFKIVAISPDRPEFLQQSMDDVEMQYTLLSDSKMEASKAFGVAFRLDDETYQRYKNNGMDLEERSGQDHHLLPAPAVFLTNDEGVIEFQYVNPDYQQRIDKDVLLAAAEAMAENQEDQM